MLSVDKISDPSCCSNISADRTDEKAPQGLDCQDEADPLTVDQTTAPNFSIRNYVFESRGKDIETNWPFAQPFLRLCLKNGIRDVLPPFESPNVVRAQCLQKLEEPDQPVASPISAKTLEHVGLLESEHVSPFDVKEAVIEQKSYSQEQFVDSTNKAVSSLSENWNSGVDQAVNLDELIHIGDPIVSTLATNEQAEQTSAPVSGIFCTVAVGKSAPEPPTESEVAELCDKLEKLKQPSEKKCRLVVKLTAISEADQIDDLTSNISAVSDLMASKVCPVCKTFSSSSNTTLNAHIDQCLSVESNTKIMSNLLKLKVKPRKKRLMVDIYADAPHGTIEDLDRRNGTNWAVELSLLVAPPSEAVPETKRQKLAMTGPRDDTTDDAVYVDSNGIKLRILSKFNDVPLVREGLKVKCNAQGKNTTKKNKHFASKFTKKMKIKSQTNSNSLKILKYQMQQVTERDHATLKNRMIDECLSNARDARITYKEGRKSTLKQWQSSKYDSAVGKFSSSDTYDNMGSMRHARRNLRLESLENRHSDNSSFLRKPANKVLKLTEVGTGSSKTKSVEFLCRAFSTSSENRTPEPPSPESEQSSKSSSSGNSFVPQLSRPSKAFMSLANKGLGFKLRSNKKSENSSEMTSSPPKACVTEHQDDSALMKNQFTNKPYFSLEARKGETGDKPSSSKIFRKHRSNLRTTKRVPKIRPAPALHASDVSPDLANPRNDDALWHLKTSTSKNVAGSEMRNQVLPIEKATQESERRECFSMMELQEYDILSTLPLESEFHANATEVEISDVQVDLVDAGDCGTSHSDELPFACGTINTEKLVVSTSSFDVDACTEKDKGTFMSSEAHVFQQFKSGSDKKEAIGDDVSGSDNLQGELVVGKTKIYDAEDAFASQLSEHQAYATSAQDSSGCLTSHEDLGYDELNKNSSITSARTMVNQEQNLESDSEPVRSTVSLPSPKDSEAEDSEIKLDAGDSCIRDRLNVSANSSSENVSGVEKESKESDQVLGTSNNVKVNDAIIEEKAFCCSCRESLSREPQFLKQNNTARTSKVKPVSNLIISPGNSSSFTRYQNRSVYTTANSSLPSGQPIFIPNTLDSTMKYPYYGDNPSPSTPSTSNATLRLMGKNLVLNHDENSQPQTNGSAYQPGTSTSTAGILCTNDLQIDHFHYQHHNQLISRSPAFGQVASNTGHQMPLHLGNPTLGGFVGPLFTGSLVAIPDQQAQPKMHEKANSYRAPCKPPEVIVIDDPPEQVSDINGCITSPTSNLPLFTSGLSLLPQGQSSYLPLQIPAFEVSAPSSNIYPSVYPRVNSIGYINQGNTTSEYQGHILPSHIVFRSTSGPMTSSIFYSETMH